jgi:hypothetical protein
MVEYNGDNFYSGDRHYYATFGSVHSNYLSHDSTSSEGTPLHLGSWPGDKHILVDLNGLDIDFPTNEFPQAGADTATTAEGTPITINVLANDSDADGDTLSITGTTDPSHGSISITDDDRILYTPEAGYTGEDTFSYSVSDGNGGEASASISINVTSDDNEDPPGNDCTPVNFASEDHLVLPQYASPGVIGSGKGNDIYLLTPSLITPGQEITISDAIGQNSIQLAEGLTITTSQVASNALQLTLNNGADITVLGADTFTYDVGGNLSACIDNPDQTFSSFVQSHLGTNVPATGVNSGTSLQVGDSALPALDVANTEDHLILPQPGSPRVVGSGVGNDTYLLTPSLITPGQEITISDAIGQNSIQLAEGLTIATSQVASNALQLTLDNGAAITVLGADEFTYEPCGNRSAGKDEADISFTAFATNILGTSIPVSGVNSAGSVTMSCSANRIALPLGSTDTYTATDESEIFTLDVEEALTSEDTTQLSINHFSLQDDQLRLNINTALGNTSLDELNGVDGIAVQDDPINNQTMVNFGTNSTGEVVSLALMGITDPGQVMLDAI